jgi:hypothetical protein
MGRPGDIGGSSMISEKLLANREIKDIDLLHGELKSLMYNTQQEIEESTGIRRAYLEGMLEAYSLIYRETYRISLDR